MAKPGKHGASASLDRVLVQNRRARFDYEILERYEAGLVLEGSEVKSIREGTVNLGQSYAAFQGRELFLVAAHISPYLEAHRRNHEPLRPRKLLMHRRELDRLAHTVSLKGLTLVPLVLYTKQGRIKLELGLARGRKHADKRTAIREREHRHEIRKSERDGS